MWMKSSGASFPYGDAVAPYAPNTCSETPLLRNEAAMRVLGVDPGLTRCGLGVVSGDPGRRLSAVAYGVIRTPPTEDIAARLLALDEQITAWIVDWAPELVAVERVFSQHNVRTVMGTAQAAAVAITAAARAGVPVAMHTPSEVKAAVTGNGRADKAQVGAMVTRLLGLDAPPTPADTADALALAICAVWRGSAIRKLEQSRVAHVNVGGAR
jgi:crossover junction endodeoxyribonuclease RuvC